MSQTVSLASGTRFRTKSGLILELAGAVNVIFAAANNLDAVAEILAAMSKEDPLMAANLALNVGVLNRQVVAPADGLGGYDANTALDVTYGPGGQKQYTSDGLVPNLVPASTSVENAAPTILVATFDQNVNSVANDYKVGFSVKVATVARTISSAARQADHKVIWFTLASAVTAGQAVVLSFDSSLSDVKSDTGAKLQSFTDSVVLNHV